eukprot:3917274-Prymnesium_polylepis.2
MSLLLPALAAMVPPASPQAPALPPSHPPPSPMDRNLYPLGAAFAIAAGVTIALSMNVQRYSLMAQEAQIKVLGLCTLPKFWVWMIGMILYGVGSGGLYAIAGLWIPLTLLTALYITLLVFNPFFSRAINGDVMTPPKVRGTACVFLGVVLAAVGSPTDAKTEYTSDQIADLFSEPGG